MHSVQLIADTFFWLGSLPPGEHWLPPRKASEPLHAALGTTQHVSRHQWSVTLAPIRSPCDDSSNAHEPKNTHDAPQSCSIAPLCTSTSANPMKNGILISRVVFVTDWLVFIAVNCMNCTMSVSHTKQRHAHDETTSKDTAHTERKPV